MMHGAVIMRGLGGFDLRPPWADIVTVFRCFLLPCNAYILENKQTVEEMNDEARIMWAELVECWVITPRFLSSGRELVCRI